MRTGRSGDLDAHAADWRAPAALVCGQVAARPPSRLDAAATTGTRYPLSKNPELGSCARGARAACLSVVREQACGDRGQKPGIRPFRMPDDDGAD